MQKLNRNLFIKFSLLSVFCLSFLLFGLNACYKSDTSIVTQVNGQTGKTPENAVSEIVKAIKNKDVNKIKELLDKKVDPNSRDENGITLLNIAILIDNNEDVCEILLKTGANPNLDDPLKFAQKKGNKKVLDLLVMYSSDGNTFVSQPRPALYEALMDCYTLPDSVNAKKFFNAARKNIPKMLDEGADVNQPDSVGNNSLFYVSDVSIDIAEKLIAKGASVNHTNKNGWTPLITAVTDNNAKVVKLLIKNGANVNAKDKDNWSVLQQSLVNSCSTIFSDLEKAGAKLD